MAKELRLVIDVALCLRAWKKVARRQRQKREKAALSAPPPLDEPQSPPPPTEAPPPSPPPPVEPPPPTPPAETAAAPDAPQAVEPPPPPIETLANATNRPPPKPLRGQSAQLPNTTLRGPVGQGGTTKLWELLRPPTQCLVLEFHALDGPRRIPPLVAVDA